MKTPEHTTELETKPAREDWIETVRRQVKSLRFGVVQIVVHDTRVVQIERTERIRLEAGAH